MGAEFRYFRDLLRINMRSALSMRAAYIIRALFAMGNHVIYMTVWIFFFSAFEDVGGWRFEHIVLAYGIALYAWGTVSFFAFGLRTLPRQIAHGEMDVFLTQPKPVLINAMVSSSQASGPGEFLLGLLMMGYAVSVAGIAPWMILPYLIIAPLVFGSMVLAYGSLEFWIDGVYDWLQELCYNIFIFASRPAPIFTVFLKFMAVTLLPVAFLTHLPIKWLMEHNLYALGWSVAGTAGLCAVSFGIFRAGLRRYESGNRFGVRG